MLGADVVVAEPPGFFDRQFDDPLGARRQRDVANHHALAAADDELDRAANLVQLHAQVLEDLGRDAFAFAHQAQQQVLGADVVVVKARRLVLRVDQDLLGALRELIEPVVHGNLRWRRPRAYEPLVVSSLASIVAFTSSDSVAIAASTSSASSATTASASLKSSATSASGLSATAASSPSNSSSM